VEEEETKKEKVEKGQMHHATKNGKELQNESDQSENLDSKKLISQPPLNLLFNRSVIVRKDDVWSINIALLLETFLKTINSSGNKDLRICGLAAVSSSMIYRLKVESIFLLEKIAMQKKRLDDPSNSQLQQIAPIPQLSALELPFRIEPTYPVSLEDLLHVLENMIMELANPRLKRNKQELELEPVETFDFDQYLVKFEKIIEEYENMIFDIVSADGMIMFKALVQKMEPLEMARCFIAMLHLAMKRKIILEQPQEDEHVAVNGDDNEKDDIKMTLSPG
jgi:segregation and condensation protein A